MTYQSKDLDVMPVELSQNMHKQIHMRRSCSMKTILYIAMNTKEIEGKEKKNNIIIKCQQRKDTSQQE